MNEEQRARLQYLREDLAVWNDRRRRARYSIAADRFYNCSAMDNAIREIQEEVRGLEALLVLWGGNDSNTQGCDGTDSRLKISSHNENEGTPHPGIKGRQRG